MATSKFAEKFLVLDEAAHGLKARLYRFLKTFAHDNPSREWFLRDDQKALHERLVKNFPADPGEEVRKAPTYEQFQQRAPEVVMKTTEFYLTLLDVIEFKEAAFKLFAAVTSETSDLKLEIYPTLTVAFMNLLTEYIRVILLIGQITDRKLIVCMYARAYNVVKAATDAQYPKVSMFLQEYEQPVRRIQDEFATFAQKIGDILTNLVFSYHKARDVANLRRENALSITTNPAEMGTPKFSQAALEIALRDDIYNWIVLGYLFCPGAITPTSIDLLKAALQEGFVLQIFREEVLYFHQEYESLFNTFKSSSMKLSKHKNVITDALNVAISTSAQVHRQSRQYLRQELQSLLNIFTDFPGLVAPKLQTLFAGLALGRYELQWYFLHLERAPPEKKTKAKHNPEDFRDKDVPHLLYLCERLQHVVLVNAKMIQQYFLEYIITVDVPVFEGMLSGLVTSTQSLLDLRTQQMAKAMLDDMKKFTVADLTSPEKNVSFAALRINWYREEAMLADGKAHHVRSPGVLEFVRRAGMIVFHTKNVDRLPQALSQHGSLRELCWFRDHISNTFKACIQDQDNAAYWCSFPRICDQFPENAHRMLPVERETIGRMAAEYSVQMTHMACMQAAGLLQRLAATFQGLEDQVLPIKAVPRVVAQVQARSTAKGDKKSKAPPTPHTATPGSESMVQNEKALVGLRAQWLCVRHICGGIAEIGEFRVYDTIQCPREFLMQQLIVNVRDQIKKLSNAKVVEKSGIVTIDSIERPSHILHRITTFVTVCKQAENYVNLDLNDVLRRAFMLEAQHDKETMSLTKAFALFYRDVIFARIPSIPSIIYSPLRQSFVNLGSSSTGGQRLDAEMYCSTTELEAVCTMVGPHGCQIIERYLINACESLVGCVKDAIKVNQQQLQELSRQYADEDTGSYGKTLAGIKGTEELLSRTVVIGNALQLRVMLRQARARVMRTHAPYIYQVAKAAVEEYPPNTYAHVDFTEADQVAQDAGLDTGSADPQWTQSLQRFCNSPQDAVVWQLLPYLYAAAFHTQSFWDRSTYLPMYGAHSNNSHTMALAVSKLMITFAALSAKGSPQSAVLTAGDRLVKETLQQFVKVGSMVLLRLRKQPQSPKELASAFIFMDKFLAASRPFLSQASLEMYLPYAVMRSMYYQMYEVQKVSKGKGKGKSVVTSAVDVDGPQD